MGSRQVAIYVRQQARYEPVSVECIGKMRGSCHLVCGFMFWGGIAVEWEELLQLSTPHTGLLAVWLSHLCPILKNNLSSVACSAALWLSGIRC